MDVKNIDSAADSSRQQPVIDRQVETDLLLIPYPNHEHHKLPLSRMAMPLLLQLLLICSIPFQSVYALITGTTVVLKTQPVDPYDILRGYYQILGYEISNFETLRKLPGWKSVSISNIQHNDIIGVGHDQSHLKKNQQIYVTLIKIKDSKPNQPQAWKPVAVSKELPNNLSADRIALRGTSSQGRVIYGLETYYMPEKQKDVVNTDIEDSRRERQQRNLLVEIKVDRRGLATPVSLWVGKKEYHF